jgi:hypothetical protein
MNKTDYTILKFGTGQTSYDIPIFLENTMEDLGVMVSFDGYMEQIEQKCNFTYVGSGNTILIYNSINTNSLGVLVDSIFTIYWGDDTTGETLNMPAINEINLPYSEHTYTSNGSYTIKITVESPWNVKEVQKNINIPFIDPLTYPMDLGELTFIVPYNVTEVTQTQEYLMDYSTITGITIESTGTTFECLSTGISRIDELKKYGTSNEYSGITTGITIENITYSAYTIDGLYYMDFSDGLTYVRGIRPESGYTEEYNGKITRNEFLIGFIEDSIIYSDIYVDRGKMGIMEKNLRLSEIDNTGELENYGNGYFNVMKT